MFDDFSFNDIAYVEVTVNRRKFTVPQEGLRAYLGTPCQEIHGSSLSQSFKWYAADHFSIWLSGTTIPRKEFFEVWSAATVLYVDLHFKFRKLLELTKDYYQPTPVRLVFPIERTIVEFSEDGYINIASKK